MNYKYSKSSVHQLTDCLIIIENTIAATLSFMSDKNWRFYLLWWIKPHSYISALCSVKMKFVIVSFEIKKQGCLTKQPYNVMLSI